MGLDVACCRYYRQVEFRPSSPRIAILGPVLVEDRSGALAEPSGVLGKSLIVALVLARGSLSVPSLVSDLWDDTPPRQERAALQTLVSRVRTVTADGLLESTPSGYALGVDDAATDLGLARRHLELARAADKNQDAATIAAETRAALALWRGEPGVELGATPLADELGRTAAALHDELLLLRARASRLLGDPEAALEDLRRLADATPLDEAVQLERMRALDAAGRRTDALRVFAEVKEAMLDRLGTRPGPELVAFNASMLVDDDTPQPPVAGARVRIGLRAAPNALIGREYDLDALEDLIATSRLTTILGAGGLGKTRLAQEIGHRAALTPSVVFVELASVRDGDDVTLALASTLGIREAAATRPGDPGARVDLRSRILGVLGERETLLIVDNCEHIVDAAAAWIGDILESVATVRVLATSRAPLAIGAEHVYPLDSLSSRARDAESRSAHPVGGGSSAGSGAGTGNGTGNAIGSDADRGPAVDLFVERARAARPGVVLPLDTIADLCERLDGLPLAIELAAARTRSMSVDEIARRLGNRFALLTGGERTAPERHRTLLAVIDWSWNLLGTSERVLLRRLSRFPDGFSADAADVVSGDGAATVLDDLEALVNQSLVTVTEDETTGILRYRLLETVREFGELALAEAGETELVQTRMADWARTFSRDALGRMNGREQVAQFRRVTAEQDNLVAILRTALDAQDGTTVVAVFATLGYYWSLRSAHTEVIAFAPGVLAALRDWEPEGEEERIDAVAVYAMIGGTFLFLDQRTSLRAITRLKRARGRGPLPDSRLDALASAVALGGRTGPSIALMERYRESTDHGLAAMGNLLLAQLAENAGELEDAMTGAQRAWDKARIAEDTWSTASAAQSLAQVHSELAHPAEAIRWAERAQSGFGELQAVGDVRQIDWIIAINSVALGDLDRARDLLERYLRDQDDTGFDYVDYLGVAYAGLAEVALAEGDDAEAVRLFREAVGIFGRTDALTNPWLVILAGAAVLSLQRISLRAPEIVGADAVAELARELRRRMLVNHMLQSSYVDKPVVGSGMMGLAGWMLAPHTADGRDASWVDSGLRLYALATRLNARQDLPSLHRDQLRAEIVGAWGVDRLDAALASAAGLPRDAAGAEAFALVRALRFGGV